MSPVCVKDAANNHEIGVRKYVGPVKVALQELDGQFPHTFQVGLLPINILFFKTSERHSIVIEHNFF